LRLARYCEESSAADRRYGTQSPEFKQALVDGLAPYRTADGRYRLSNAYHYLIARA
jgi:hypothetical protein